jgi:ferredoxin-NADP reductase
VEELIEMPAFEVRLKDRKEVAEGTMAFFFEKPAGFEFKAGQFLNYTLIDPPETDAEGNLRSFSIASAPEEEDLMLATRMRDTAFKRVLKTATLGTEVRIDGPFGSFTLHRDRSRAAVFLAGGIGVTPFRSMILDAARNKPFHRLFLFYSNRRPEDAAFLSELREIEKRSPSFQCIGTFTELEKSRQPWQGETGWIDRKMLARHLNDLAAPIYYSAGPPAMVAAMREMLVGAGIDEDSIRTEDFAGY